jgi:phosphatidylserine/phosphatidylglycerophosphate/cardiolipin synthase-like enzyme
VTQATRRRNADERATPRRLRLLVFASMIAAAAWTLPHGAAAREAKPPSKATLEALFTPGDPIDTRLVALIDSAKREVLVQAFSFTSKKIARALTAAHRRGVRVEILADRAQTLELAGSAVPGLARDGVPVWLDANFIAAHNKVIIVDADAPAATLVTGSYNFTSAAQFRNAENVLIVRNYPALAVQYRENLLRLREKAQRYDGAP